MSANGATSYQPGATHRESNAEMKCGLKARAIIPQWRGHITKSWRMDEPRHWRLE
jgi:hypothetical protein